MVWILEAILKLSFAVSICMSVVHGKFEPYADNGGTLVGIAGLDYVIVAADTRLSDNYMIHSRNATRIFEIVDGLLLTGSGCWSDMVELKMQMSQTAETYESEYEQKLRISPFAHALSVELFSRRFSPYYSLCIAAGLDKNGAGAVFKYDAVGSYERVRCTCAGKGEHMIQPLLDSLLNVKDQQSESCLWDIAAEGELNFIPINPIFPIIPTQPHPAAGDDEDQDEEDGYSRNSSSSSIGSSSSSSSISSSSISSSSVSSNSISATATNMNAGDTLVSGSPYTVGIDCDTACDAVVRAFRAAAEREISVGDGLDVWVLRRVAHVGSFGFGSRALNRQNSKLQKLHFSLPRH